MSTSSKCGSKVSNVISVECLHLKVFASAVRRELYAKIVFAYQLQSSQCGL